MTVFAQDHMLQALARIPCFEGLSDAALSRILAGTRQRQVPRGEVLIRQGDASDDLFLVLSGRFTVLSGDVPVAEIGAGEPIGELAFFSGGLRTATVIAARDSCISSRIWRSRQLRSRPSHSPHSQTRLNAATGPASGSSSHASSELSSAAISP